jgi:hypothetical protein
MNKPNIITQKSLEGMTREELVDLREHLEDEIRTITHNLGVSRRKARTEGVYADPDWFNRAEKALMWKRRQTIMVAKALRTAKSEKEKSTDYHFVAVARERLPGDLFQELMNEAHDRVRLAEMGDWEP